MKVGTKVRIKKDLHVGHDYKAYVNSGMAKHAGKIAKILCVGESWYVIDLDGGVFRWTLDMFEPVKEECVVIYRKDREVIALDKLTGKTATAKCHPADEFNFAIGAKLALDRLTKIAPASKFQVGDKVIANAKANKYYGITREGWKGYVTQVLDDDGYMRVDNDKTNIDHGYIVLIDCFELDDGPEPEYFNGKAVCVENGRSFLTKGKIYEFKDGTSIDDDGDRIPYYSSPIKSIDELNKRYSITKFIEVIE